MSDDTGKDEPSEPAGDDDDFVTDSHYAKVFASILDSSIWFEGMATRLVWITMLTLCDRDGFVEASDPGICHRANVPKAEGLAALKTLSAPDLESKSKEWGGRRIERVQGGWKILNYEKYRDAQTPKQKATALRVARFRAKRAAEAEWSKAHVGQPFPDDWADNWERYVTHGSAPSVSVAVSSSSTSSSVGSPSDVDNSVEGVEKSPASEPTGSAESRVLEALESDLDREAFRSILAVAPNRKAWAAECGARLDGMHPPMLTPRQLGEAIRDYVGNGHHERPNFKHFRAYLARPDRPKDDGTEGGGAAGPLKPSGNGPTGEAGAILARLKGGSMKGEPDDIRQAVEALGGLGAIRDCKPDRWGFLVKDFVAHLAFARANPKPPESLPALAPAVQPPPAEERPAMREAREKEEAWLAEHPGQPLPAEFHDWRSMLKPHRKGGSKDTPEV